MYTPTTDDKTSISSVYPVSSQYVYSENYLEEAGSLESQINQDARKIFVLCQSVKFCVSRWETIILYLDREFLGFCAFENIGLATSL